VNGVLQLAEFLGTSWVLWRLSALAYRPRTPRDARDVERWPVEADEPAARTVPRMTARGRR
jgi:hypothetical protein